MMPKNPFLAIYWIACGTLLGLIVLQMWLIVKGSAGNRLKAQDILLVLTWCTMFLSGVTATMAVQFENDMRNLLTPGGESHLMRLSYISWISTVTCLSLTKATLMSMFVRVRTRLPRILGGVVLVGAVYIAVGFGLTFFWSMFWCGPDLRNNWTPDASGGICLMCVQFPLMTTFTVISLSTDLVLMSIGLFILREVKITGRRQYVAFALVLTTGVLSMVASCVRFGVLVQTPFQNVIKNFELLVNITCWFSLEVSCAVIACSFPTIRGLWRLVPRHEKQTGLENPMKKDASPNDPFESYATADTNLTTYDSRGGSDHQAPLVYLPARS